MYEKLTTDTPVPLEEVDNLRQALSEFFSVVDTTLDNPTQGQVRFRGHFSQEPVDCFDKLKARFERHGFTPLIRSEQDLTAVIGIPVVFNPPPSNWWINLLLFIATIFSTLYIGSIYELQRAVALSDIWQGGPFSLSILLILGAHELGHYFAARYHGVAVTLPYFIPVPTILGTMGAFIRLKEPIKNRRVLLDVGVSGPLAGMAFAIPILLYGLATSQVIPLDPNGCLEGNSLLYILAKFAVFGEFLRMNGRDVQINSIAMAGWAGLLVTGLNLLPLGQLDGGHVAYVLFGQKARLFFWPVIFGLVGLVLLTQTTMWVVWILLLFFLGQRHAETLDTVTELDKRRYWIAIFTLVLFFLVFTPIPLSGACA